MACDLKITKPMTSQSSISDVIKAPRRCSNPHVRRMEKIIIQRSASVEKLNLSRERNEKIRRNTVSSEFTDSRKSSMKDDVFMSPKRLPDIVSYNKF